ncbi:Hypothetical Protein FCC1311_026562 [Hondaea fermentalgiana]|uniref:Uncharacterized protein n=1 Tax=Hondaea fermentalgiana TaxID=2315210 RepID=A0A2R5G7C4_9STRA|nr:Hypothetical Protein FCC1311_026562 [Hondaea fermentalgiana]|eukprot:GBG26435.1 Hypothetical Protein FCC1311_026562 [Hondaea fermentalgiana]
MLGMTSRSMGTPKKPSRLHMGVAGWCFCAGVATLVCILLLDEILTVNLMGGKERNLHTSCDDGLMDGAAAQQVCILDEKVIKLPRACTDPHQVLACKWRYWKQQYTNHHWKNMYSRLPFVADVLSYDGTKIEMERAHHHADVEPQRLANKFRMEELDAWLEINGHIMLDVAPRSNVFLDARGGILFIDFNIVPRWARELIERYDSNSRRIEPFRNIYGYAAILDWVAH